MLKHTIFCLFIALSYYVNGTAASTHPEQRTQNFKDSLSQLDSTIDDILEKFNVPGIALGVVVDDQIILSKGYGFRNVLEQLPVTEKTLFSIGSCTKAFTALLLGQLVDENKITWDDPVVLHIPEFRLIDEERTSTVTIRDLLAHRTGLPRHDAVWFLSDISREKFLDILPYLEPQSELRKEFQYNNIMYALAGIVIERVTGQTWEEALLSRIFAPLEMTHSNALLQEMLSSSDFSQPYVDINGDLEKVKFHDILCVNPGGGINSTVRDMIKWIQLHLSEKNTKHLIQSETLKETHTIQISIPFNQGQEIYHSGYALGWLVGNYRGEHLLNHPGNTDGFASEVTLLPEKKIGIVVLTNSSTDGRYVSSCISNIILDCFLGIHGVEWVQLTKLNHVKIKNLLKEIRTQNYNRPLSYPPRPVVDYAGEYRHPGYGTVGIRMENNKLLASYGNHLIPLLHKYDNVFTGEFTQLAYFGISAFVDFSFFSDDSNIIRELHIPFEEVASAKAIVFSKR